jgi:hypothetical protein
VVGASGASESAYNPKRLRRFVASASLARVPNGPIFSSLIPLKTETVSVSIQSQLPFTRCSVLV